MNTALGPTCDEVLAQVGKREPRSAVRLLRPGLALVALVLVAGTFVWRGRVGAVQPTRFLVTSVTRGDLSSTVTATGTLRGKDTVNVGAEASGRVKAIYVDFNAHVKAGQILAEIDPAPIQANLAQATAKLAAARANVKNAEATAAEAELTAERSRTLAADGLASKQELETAEAAALRSVASMESARAQVIEAQATVHSNQTLLEKTQVRSPIDGVVLSRDVEVGQTLVAAMDTPLLFTVARDLRDMEVKIAIDEADIGQAQVGQKATFTVDAWPARSFDGVLRAIHNVAKTTDNVVTYEALLSVPNGELLLRPGMTATVTIHTAERKGVLLVPNAALRFAPPVESKRPPLSGPPEPVIVQDERPRVWLLVGGKPVELLVDVGLTDGSQTEIASPQLREGVRVITDSMQVGAP